MQNLLRRILYQTWYLRQPPWDTGISPPELIEFIKQHPPGRAIDIGCGTGTNVIALAEAGWQVTGIDFVPRAIKLAKQKTKKAGVQATLTVNDATKLSDVSGPFDLALDIGCFHSIPPDGREKYLNQLDRILAPNGFWFWYGFLRSDTDPSGIGLAEADLDRISTRFTLRSRRNSFDRERPSAWLLFQKKPF